MSKRLATSIGLATALLATVSTDASGATLTVGKPNSGCVGAQVSTITAAINAANPGDEIRICPALYDEQLVVTKPLTLRGVAVANSSRVLVRPSSLQPLDVLSGETVISVINTAGVKIENLAVDAGANETKGCEPRLAARRFLNSSGTIEKNAIYGAALKNPQTCPGLFPGNGFGVLIDATLPGPFSVQVKDNSIRDFTRNGVLAMGAGVTAVVESNSIAGQGPSTGTLQFGVFIANGTVGRVKGNMISQGNCGKLSFVQCWDLRSEGVVLRSAGSGTIVDGNTITNAQNGVFVNGADNAVITNNVIRNIDVLSGIHLQRTTNSKIEGNRIYGVGPMDENASTHLEGCGINEISGAGNMGNTIFDNAVSDAYCGVAHVTGSVVLSGVYVNTLYTTFNSDLYPDAYPPATPAR